MGEVRRAGSARVADLASLLGVSDMTVRRDLDVLDDAGLVVKVHGGATTPRPAQLDEPGFEAKSVRNIDEKRGDRAAPPRRGSAPGAAIGLTRRHDHRQLAAELVSRSPT